MNDKIWWNFILCSVHAWEGLRYLKFVLLIFFENELIVLVHLYYIIVLYNKDLQHTLHVLHVYYSTGCTFAPYCYSSGPTCKSLRHTATVVGLRALCSLRLHAPTFHNTHTRLAVVFVSNNLYTLTLHFAQWRMYIYYTLIAVIYSVRRLIDLELSFTFKNKIATAQKLAWVRF